MINDRFLRIILIPLKEELRLSVSYKLSIMTENTICKGCQKRHLRKLMYELGNGRADYENLLPMTSGYEQ